MPEVSSPAANNPTISSKVNDSSSSGEAKEVETSSAEEKRETAQELEEESPTLQPEDLEEGFCKDDIYGKYLSKEYYERKDVRDEFKKAKRLSRKKRESLRKKIDTEMMFFARTRMLGSTPPYFGAIPVVTNPEVEFWMRYFQTQGRSMFMTWLIRGKTIQKVLTPILKEQGLPPEFFFLAMVESGLSNIAYSRARATGPWQFMRGTAKLYGLKVNYWIDERRDPVKSSVAAAKLLIDLYGQFGDWYLAMAAYNAGPGKIMRAIRKANSRDFWQLTRHNYLRSETKHYVPKVLAALIIASDPREHGFEIESNPLDILPETTVTIKKPLKIHNLATKLGLPVKQLQVWNPEIVRTVTPPVKTGYRLRLPPEYVAKFEEIENQLYNSASVNIKDILFHLVKRGDSLYKIARQYKVSIREIQVMNPDLKPNRLKVGQSLAIPF